MDDIGDVACAFCGSTMELSREMPASSVTHPMRFYSCDTCGASEVRIGQALHISDEGAVSKT